MIKALRRFKQYDALKILLDFQKHEFTDITPRRTTSTDTKLCNENLTNSAVTTYFRRPLTKRIIYDTTLFNLAVKDRFVFKCISMETLTGLIGTTIIKGSGEQLYSLNCRFILLENHKHWNDLQANATSPIHLITYINASKILTLEQSRGNSIFLQQCISYQTVTLEYPLQSVSTCKPRSQLSSITNSKCERFPLQASGRGKKENGEFKSVQSGNTVVLRSFQDKQLNQSTIPSSGISETCRRANDQSSRHTVTIGRDICITTQRSRQQQEFRNQNTKPLKLREAKPTNSIYYQPMVQNGMSENTIKVKNASIAFLFLLLSLFFIIFW